MERLRREIAEFSKTIDTICSLVDLEGYGCFGTAMKNSIVYVGGLGYGYEGMMYRPGLQLKGPISISKASLSGGGAKRLGRAGGDGCAVRGNGFASRRTYAE